MTELFNGVIRNPTAPRTAINLQHAFIPLPAPLRFLGLPRNRLTNARPHFCPHAGNPALAPRSALTHLAWSTHAHTRKRSSCLGRKTRVARGSFEPIPAPHAQ